MVDKRSAQSLSLICLWVCLLALFVLMGCTQPAPAPAPATPLPALPTDAPTATPLPAPTDTPAPPVAFCG